MRKVIIYSLLRLAMYLGQSDEQGFYYPLATKPSMCVARKYPDPNHGGNFSNCHPTPPK